MQKRGQRLSGPSPFKINNSIFLTFWVMGELRRRWRNEMMIMKILLF